MAFQYEVEELENGQVMFQVPTQELDVEKNSALLKANLEASPHVFHRCYQGAKIFKGNCSSDLFQFKTRSLQTDPSDLDVKQKIVHHFTVEQQPSSDYIILTMDLSQYDKDSAQAALELVHAYGQELRLRLDKKNKHIVSINVTGTGAPEALEKYQKDREAVIENQIRSFNTKMNIGFGGLALAIVTALIVIFILGAVTANPVLLLIALGGASATFFLGAPIASELDKNTDKYYISEIVRHRYDQEFARARVVEVLPKNTPSVLHVDTSTLEIDSKPSEQPASTNTVESNSNESENSLPKPRL